MMKDLSIEALYKNNSNIINLTTNSLTQIYTISIQTMFILVQFSLILRNRKKKHAKRKTTQKAKKKEEKGKYRKSLLSIPVHKQENNNRKNLREKQDEKRQKKISSSLCYPVYHMHKDWEREYSRGGVS